MEETAQSSQVMIICIKRNCPSNKFSQSPESEFVSVGTEKLTTEIENTHFFLLSQLPNSENPVWCRGKWDQRGYYDHMTTVTCFLLSLGLCLTSVALETEGGRRINMQWWGSWVQKIGLCLPASIQHPGIKYSQNNKITFILEMNCQILHLHNTSMSTLMKFIVLHANQGMNRWICLCTVNLHAILWQNNSGGTAGFWETDLIFLWNLSACWRMLVGREQRILPCLYSGFCHVCIGWNCIDKCIDK